MERFQSAKERFERARRKALRQDLAARVTGAPRDLLPFTPFENYLRAYGRIEHRETESILLDRIVGSVGRYRDFTRSFLPRTNAMKDRWAFVQQRLTSMEGLPPIEVFKVGEVYFVADGNHRVSAARVNGFKQIEALVTEYPVDPGLEPGDSLDAALCKAGRAAFLDGSGLAGRVPDDEFLLTWPGGYRRLAEHVHLQSVLMQEAAPDRNVTPSEAALAWYELAYLPVMEVIRQHDLLRSFPGRTAADLYVWVWGALLKMHYLFGDDMDPQEGADLLALRAEFAPRGGLLSEFARRLRGEHDGVPDWMLDALE